ncbi:hypothetical protein Desti_2260 [Desulfomonile tiedjei DSM 6799]|uniref:Uncharacterized protein n=1 Tax=Desulfomonile tiedjei (strain ATCC 49306 / DSM 6799 / DCB-1) TaxID=706587 RepID=I4C5V9_DESTA|nr:hypothetical protein Desti_2260 [Desulfomonile tiedjei DSM 6799]
MGAAGFYHRPCYGPCLYSFMAGYSQIVTKHSGQPRPNSSLAGAAYSLEVDGAINVRPDILVGIFGAYHRLQLDILVLRAVFSSQMIPAPKAIASNSSIIPTIICTVFMVIFFISLAPMNEPAKAAAIPAMMSPVPS